MAFDLWVAGRLPGLNELLNQKGTTNGKWNGYNAIKCQWYGQIALLARARGIAMQEAGFGSFLFCEPTMRRDPDNLVAGGVKLLLDSLVGCEVLPGDDWATNLGFIGYWTLTPRRAGCLVHWGNELLGKDSMLELLKKEDGENGTSHDGRRTFDHEPHRQAARKGAG